MHDPADTAFTSCDNKSFVITFPNGYNVCVQWGPFDACSNRSRKPNPRMPDRVECYTAANAEVLVWHEDIDDGYPLVIHNGECSHGYCNTQRVLLYLIRYATMEAPNGEHTKKSVYAD